MAYIIFWFVSVLLFISSICHDVPEAALDDNNCPVGPGVNNKTIVINTNATCRCVITKQVNPPAQARWYTRDNKTVGAENNNDKSSVLSLSYNSSDPNPTYQCRPYTTQNTAGNAVTYTPQFRCSYEFLEVGSKSYAVYFVPAGVKSVMWQLMSNGIPLFNMSTCSVQENKCTDFYPNVTNGEMNQKENYSDLKITFALPIMTQFSALADNGDRSCISEFEIYEWPFPVNCDAVVTPTYVDINCTTARVYPTGVGNLIRQEKPLVDEDFDLNYTHCSLVNPDNQVNTPLPYTCTWRLKMERMLPNNNFHGEISALVTNHSKVDYPPAGTLIIIDLSVPEVVLYYLYCPTKDGEVIPKGENSSCKCVPLDTVYYPGQARWYTKDNRIVGIENETDRSSTLTLIYNSSDPKPTYYCAPFTTYPGIVSKVFYYPNFSASPPLNVITGLLSLIIIIGVVLH